MTLISGAVLVRRAVLTATALLLACGVDSRTESPARDGDRHGGTLRLALAADPGTLDPLRMSTAQAARVLALLQPGLFRLDPETGRFGPGLALEWQLGPDSLRFDVRLDTTLRWSDGEAFLSDDVRASFDLYRDERAAYPRAQLLGAVADVDELDAANVRFRFSQKPFDPCFTLSHDILPAHVLADWEPGGNEVMPLANAPITLGPYRLAAWDRDRRLLLERNPHHPGPRGFVDAIDLRVLPDAATRVLQLRTGEIDVVGSIPPATAAGLVEEEGVRVADVEDRTVVFFQFNLERPALADGAVRHALSLAVDRKGIVERIYYGFARPAASFFPPVSWAHDSSLRPDPFDLSRARRLLDEAGFSDRDGDGLREDEAGHVLRLRLLTVAGHPEREALATLVRGAWAELGVELQTRPLELGAFIAAARQQDFDVLLAQLGGPIDADVRPFLTSSGRFNFGSYESARADSLAVVAATAVSRAVRMDAAIALQRHVARERPLAMILYPARLVALRERVRDATPNYLSPYDRVERWWLQSESR